METKKVVPIRLYPSVIAEIEKRGSKQKFIEDAIKEKLEREPLPPKPSHGTASI